jgi:hypothetical protein
MPRVPRVNRAAVASVDATAPLPRKSKSTPSPVTFIDAKGCASIRREARGKSRVDATPGLKCTATVEVRREGIAGLDVEPWLVLEVTLRTAADMVSVVSDLFDEFERDVHGVKCLEFVAVKVGAGRDTVTFYLDCTEAVRAGGAQWDALYACVSRLLCRAAVVPAL